MIIFQTECFPVWLMVLTIFLFSCVGYWLGELDRTEGGRIDEAELEILRDENKELLERIKEHEMARGIQ